MRFLNGDLGGHCLSLANLIREYLHLPLQVAAVAVAVAADNRSGGGNQSTDSADAPSRLRSRVLSIPVDHTPDVQQLGLAIVQLLRLHSVPEHPKLSVGRRVHLKRMLRSDLFLHCLSVNVESSEENAHIAHRLSLCKHG